MLARGPAPQVSHFLTKSAASGVQRPGHARDPLGVSEDVIGHRNPANDVLQLDDVVAVQHLRYYRLHVGSALPHDLFFLAVARIVDVDHEQEAVELGLGQRIGAFLLDGVLRGQHEERILHRMVDAADGGLAFLHRFEQGGLRLGRRAVDFVGQHDVGEDRPGQELEGPLPGDRIVLNDFRAGDVGRHEVGRELDALERQVERLGQRAHHQGLGQARNADEQGMAAAEDRHQAAGREPPPGR